MRILIAPNAFKNSLDAAAAADAIRDGFLKSELRCSCQCLPVGDGGDGTATLLVQRLHGKQVPVQVSDPLGRRIKTSFGIIEHAETAIIEMADAAGIRLLKAGELNPLIASSFGTGEMIKAALDKNVKKMIIGMGGSATVDGGCGILRALGIRFMDRTGKELQNLPADLVNLSHIDTQNLDQRIFRCEIVVLCDVNNSLLGEKGAAVVFGPQKGATPLAVKQLDAALSKLAEIGALVNGKNMAEVLRGGTAGGAAAGLYAFVNAELVNGIEYFLDSVSFDVALATADMVVTGEGSIDEQTLNGKAPYGVACRARQKNIPVIGMAGKIPTEPSLALLQFFDRLLSINHEISDMATSLRLTGRNLTRTAMELGNELASKK
jgi:glycerate kinase